MEIITKSASETREAAYQFANTLKKHHPSVIALVGDLGSGKTTFVQGFANALGIANRIISPTFILMRQYNFKKKTLYHLDLYRIENELGNEVANLGLEEIWSNPKNIVVIEWAEKIKDSLPKDTQWVTFEYVGNDERKIVIE